VTDFFGQEYFLSLMPSKESKKGSSAAPQKKRCALRHCRRNATAATATASSAQICHRHLVEMNTGDLLWARRTLPAPTAKTSDFPAVVRAVAATRFNKKRKQT
jgi:hypothetical protein